MDKDIDINNLDRIWVLSDGMDEYYDMCLSEYPKKGKNIVSIYFSHDNSNMLFKVNHYKDLKYKGNSG